MKRFFIYPLNQRKNGSPNPYVDKLATNLSEGAKVVNRKAKHRGVINLFLYLFRSDVFILNWVESFPTKRFGILQSAIFILFLKIARLLKKDVLWILHNKGSHHGGHKQWTERLFRALMKESSHIITHSQEGLEFVLDNYSYAASKVTVISHPVDPLFQRESNEDQKKFDILIWGSLFPYKGVDRFLEYIHSVNVIGLKVLIVGRCTNKDYVEKLGRFLANNIVYRNELLSMTEIAGFASQSKFVLFTYKAETILSSGVLMDTLRMGCRILGPNYGAFRDLSSLGVVQVYGAFDEVIDACESYKPISKNELDEVAAFAKDNSWEVFAGKIRSLFR